MPVKSLKLWGCRYTDSDESVVSTLELVVDMATDTGTLTIGEFDEMGSPPVVDEHVLTLSHCVALSNRRDESMLQAQSRALSLEDSSSPAPIELFSRDIDSLDGNWVCLSKHMYLAPNPKEEIPPPCYALCSYLQVRTGDWKIVKIEKSGPAGVTYTEVMVGISFSQKTMATINDIISKNDDLAFSRSEAIQITPLLGEWVHDDQALESLLLPFVPVSTRRSRFSSSAWSSQK